jgi:hypothetical protein
MLTAIYTDGTDKILPTLIEEINLPQRPNMSRAITYEGITQGTEVIDKVLHHYNSLLEKHIYNGISDIAAVVRAYLEKPAEYDKRSRLCCSRNGLEVALAEYRWEKTSQFSQKRGGTCVNFASALKSLVEKEGIKSTLIQSQEYKINSPGVARYGYRDGQHLTLLVPFINREGDLHFAYFDDDWGNKVLQFGKNGCSERNGKIQIISHPDQSNSVFSHRFLIYRNDTDHIERYFDFSVHSEPLHPHSLWRTFQGRFGMCYVLRQKDNLETSLSLVVNVAENTVRCRDHRSAHEENKGISTINFDEVLSNPQKLLNFLNDFKEINPQSILLDIKTIAQSRELIVNHIWSQEYPMIPMEHVYKTQ